jgi:hemerythrin superfamily protein
MGQLEDDVEHHASEEEDKMFPRVEKLMPERTREDLAQQMLAMKQRLSRGTCSGATPSHSSGA